MKVLFFDSSTEILVVGLARQDGKDSSVTWRSEKTGLNHAQKILTSVEEIFEETRTSATALDALACTLGPGSFTGLRIGLCTAKGLAEGWSLPLVGLNSLEAMARTAFFEAPLGPTLFLPVIDARKGRFYTEVFTPRGSNLESFSAPFDLLPEDFLTRWQETSVSLCGYQAELLAERLKDRWPPPWKLQQGKGWEVALGNLALEATQKKTPLAPGAGPRYIRPSEAEENLRKT
jgi:tRNA threonylcarbamoyladenosine biosynthesis protein TsaB